MVDEFQDRHATADGCGITDLAVMPAGKLVQAFDVEGDNRLVGGDQMAALAQHALAERAGKAGAAEGFHDNVRLVGEGLGRIIGEAET